MTAELAVIVTTHNRADLVDEALASLADQTWRDGSWKVVVVDNASTDATPEVLARWAGQMPVPFEIVTATDGRGPSYARNAGVDAAAAPNLAFVDDDDIVGAGWVAAIGEALRNEPLVASRFDYDRLNPPAVAAHHVVNVDALPCVGDTPVASSAGLGCRRDLWERLGGNDTALRHGEDIDFSLRASAGGTDPAFEPGAVYHVRLRDGAGEAWRRGRHLGRASVDLHVRHGRERGERRDRLGVVLRSYLGYLARVPDLARSDRRIAYAEQLGRRIGRLEGSFRHRIWFP
ncbi:MAG: glycosyltransferase family A protein [Actinomycetota bacterium]